MKGRVVRIFCVLKFSNSQVSSCLQFTEEIITVFKNDQMNLMTVQSQNSEFHFSYFALQSLRLNMMGHICWFRLLLPFPTLSIHSITVKKAVWKHRIVMASTLTPNSHGSLMTQKRSSRDPQRTAN